MSAGGKHNDGVVGAGWTRHKALEIARLALDCHQHTHTHTKVLKKGEGGEAERGEKRRMEFKRSNW